MNAHQRRPRRTWLAAATLLIVSGSGALVGCSKDDDAAPSSTETSQSPALPLRYIGEGASTDAHSSIRGLHSTGLPPKPQVITS